MVKTTVVQKNVKSHPEAKGVISMLRVNCLSQLKRQALEEVLLHHISYFIALLAD